MYVVGGMPAPHANNRTAWNVERLKVGNHGDGRRVGARSSVGELSVSVSFVSGLLVCVLAPECPKGSGLSV